MTNAIVNVEMAAAWDGDEGAEWARDWERYDRAVEPHHLLLVEAAQITSTDRVLDIGCGNGQTTRSAARDAMAGSALGIDLSTRMIERARQLAIAEGLTNVSFEQADAQAHAFEVAARDVALSRFGTMFFADQQAAFTNIASALAPGGRIVMIAWRGVADNEWLQCVFSALAVGRDLPVPPAGTPGPFGLADDTATRATLGAAGFESIEIVPVDLPFWLGSDAADAFAFFRGTGIVRGMTEGLDDERRALALERLQTTMTEHHTDRGVEFGSGSWLISAVRSAR